MRLLVVDDEPQIRKLLRTGLRGYGYEVVTAANGEEALIRAAQTAPDLIILDITLGSAPNGLEVCRVLRGWSHIPIIMLSVVADEKTKVQALDAGADDYLTKPFGMEELRARIQAVRRRTAARDAGAESAEIAINGLYIDLANRRVTVHGEEVHLTPIEYNILCLLAANPGKVLTHQTILVKVWGAEYREMTHYIRVYMNQLRRKLGENPAANVRYILNEPGVGYRLISPD